jgi:8-oxo-dGTP diphosphatase
MKMRFSEIVYNEWMKPRAVAIIIDPSRQMVLLIHRLNQGRAYYVLPGGKIEEGETPAEACVREALEETGLTITLGPCVASFVNQGRVEHYFLAAGFSGELALGFPEKGWQTAENVYALEWVPAAQLPGLALMPEQIRPVVMANFPK